MFLLIWFKAGIQTSPPIVPLDRETQAQPLGKLLFCQERSGAWAALRFWSARIYSIREGVGEH